MRTLLLDALDNDPIAVEEEPALEIALPQVFAQPRLTTLRRNKLPNLEWLVAKLYRRYADEHPDAEAAVQAGALGPEYQDVVQEFDPLLAWAAASWDFLLSTEGCRFVPRSGDERLYCRGDFRAVTDRDFSRLSHRVFRQCVLAHARTAGPHSLTSYLRARFWDEVALAYRRLEDPPDRRQRTLTAYSYLRCSPYRFLNRFHHDLVYGIVGMLSGPAHRAVERYFLNFYTLESTADALQTSPEVCAELLRQTATRLLVRHRLVYCLLRQIERY